MSTLSYRGIVLDVTETVEYSRTPVHDARNNYLYTTVRIRVRGYLNEDATAYTRGMGRGSQVRPSDRGVNSLVTPAVTANAVRHVLEQPRGELIYTDGDVEMIHSPNGAETDAANGPITLEGITLVAALGSSTMQVEVGFETYINECGEFHNTVSPLLSHTWEMSEQVNWQERCTRTIKGRATFAADRLAMLDTFDDSAFPDNFRGYIVHPCPKNFQRTSVNVLASEDGLGVMYEVVDKSGYINILPPGIKKLEGVHSVGFSRVSAEQAAIQAASTAFEIAEIVSERAFRIATSGVANPNPLAATAAALPATGAGLGGVVARTGLAVIRGVAAILPKIWHVVLVRVWGNLHTTHTTLSRFAHRVAVAHLGGQVGPGLFSSEVVETRAVEDGFVEVKITATGGFTAGTIAGATLFANIFSRTITPDISNHFPPLVVPAAVLDLVTQRDRPGNAFSSGNGTRGDRLSAIVASDLLQPCETPPNPKDTYPNTISRSPEDGA
jgi:hypothetical protein